MMLYRLARFTQGYSLSVEALTEKQFLKIGYAKIQELTERAQQHGQQFDVYSNQSILKISKGLHVIVINTQTPNRQLWYSSTISGPHRFDYVSASRKWMSYNEEIGSKMDRDMSQM